MHVTPLTTNEQYILNNLHQILDNTNKATINHMSKIDSLLTKIVNDTNKNSNPDGTVTPTTNIFHSAFLVNVPKTIGEPPLEIIDWHFTSSDESVATVDSVGLVTRVEGTSGEWVVINFDGYVNDPVYGNLPVHGDIALTLAPLTPIPVELNGVDLEIQSY